MIRPIHWLLLALVVVGAGAMRFADLGGRPNGLFRDEAEKGYNAWAIATTGGAIEFTTDPKRPIVWRPLPWMLDVMGSRTSTIYQYASVPFMWAGGLSVATTRMAAATAGTLAVLIVGLLFMRAWGAGIGIAAATWTALCPWHIVFSRWALQSAFVPMLMALVLAGLYGVEMKKRWGWPLAGAAMGWLFYTYSGAQPMALAWGACLVVIYRREILRSPVQVAIGAALFLLPVVPTLYVTLAPGGAARLSNVSVWSQPAATPVSGVFAALQNYLSYFNPVFLFWRGDISPRHAIPGVGQLLPIDLILLPIGLIWSIRSKRPLAWAMLAAWLCAPIPAAITIGPHPHGLRSFGMALPSAVWAGAGLCFAAGWTRRRETRWRLDLLVWVAALAIALSVFARYWQTYKSDVRVQIAFEKGESLSWEQIAANHQPGQRVYISVQVIYAQYFQLFYLQMPPRETALNGLSRGGDFVYFDVRQKLDIKKGDWIVLPIAPWRFPNENAPILSIEEAAPIGEYWVFTKQN